MTEAGSGYNRRPMHTILVIFFRWLHIFSACVAIGGVFFARVVLPLGLKVLEPEARHAAFLKMRRGFKMVIHPCMLCLIVSGVYNSMANWGIYHQIPEQAHPFWGTHVLLALGIFTVAIYMLAGKEPPVNHARWAVVNLILMALAVVTAGALKYVRDNRPRPVVMPVAADLSHVE